ncbi:MAG: type IX secretion system membrane protein PorP/SprF, partial [Phaeodactylibacter sp.]|nr:type IX secretion system membrane protein PorP/SprF [Phaeodactylibacter sp.]
MKHQFRLLLFTFLIAAQTGFAQDKHFSQFFANPITLNPALSGAFDGRLRLAGIYRDQWRDQLSEPYVTFAGSLDMRVPVGKKGSNYKDALGVGVL